MNQRLLTGYEPTLIHFGSNILKIAFVLLGTANTHFFSNEGQHRPPFTPPTPLCHTYYKPSGHEDSPGSIQNMPYLYKKMSI